MVNPEQALVLMLKGLRIFYLVILVLYHQLKELQNLKFGNVNCKFGSFCGRINLSLYVLIRQARFFIFDFMKLTLDF